MVCYAGFWKRVLAFIIDNLVLFIPLFVVDFVFALTVMVNGAVPSSFDLQSQFLNGLLVLIYFIVMESSSLQATVGKLALGIKVVDLEGQRITLGKALVRYISKFLSAFILFFGYFMIGWTDRKQGLHDKVADTLVICK